MKNKIQVLIESAENYAEDALKELILDAPPIAADEYGTGEFAEIVDAVAYLQSVNPIGYTRMAYKITLIVHFLFPNLTPEERHTIERRLSQYPLKDFSDSHRENFVESGKEVEKFEGKLTVTQIEILESPLFFEAGL